METGVGCAWAAAAAAGGLEWKVEWKLEWGAPGRPTVDCNTSSPNRENAEGGRGGGTADSVTLCCNITEA